MSIRPPGSTAIACQPRLPAASVPGTSAAGENDRPPSSERDCSSFVPFSPLVVQTTTIAGSRRGRGTSATCGGCSPLTRASPSRLLTRTGEENVRAPSRLMATKTSVDPLGWAPLQATATTSPSAATVGVALRRPATLSSIDAVAPASGADGQHRPKSASANAGARSIHRIRNTRLSLQSQSRSAALEGCLHVAQPFRAASAELRAYARGWSAGMRACAM